MLPVALVEGAAWSLSSRVSTNSLPGCICHYCGLETTSLETLQEAIASNSLLLFTRSSILTGKYTHNHHTYENTVQRGCDAPSWRTLNENTTMGPYMSMAGYKTGFFGELKHVQIYTVSEF